MRNAVVVMEIVVPLSMFVQAASDFSSARPVS